MYRSSVLVGACAELASLINQTRTASSAASVSSSELLGKEEVVSSIGCIHGGGIVFALHQTALVLMFSRSCCTLLTMSNEFALVCIVEMSALN